MTVVGGSNPLIRSQSLSAVTQPRPVTQTVQQPQPQATTTATLAPKSSGNTSPTTSVTTIASQALTRSIASSISGGGLQNPRLTALTVVQQGVTSLSTPTSSALTSPTPTTHTPLPTPSPTHTSASNPTPTVTSSMPTSTSTSVPQTAPTQAVNPQPNPTSTQPTGQQTHPTSASITSAPTTNTTTPTPQVNPPTVTAASNPVPQPTHPSTTGLKTQASTAHDSGIEATKETPETTARDIRDGMLFITGQGNEKTSALAGSIEDLFGALGNASKNIGDAHAGNLGAINAFSAGIGSVVSGVGAIVSRVEASSLYKVSEKCTKVADDIRDFLATNPNHPEKESMQKLEKELRSTSNTAKNLADRAVSDSRAQGIDFIGNTASTVGGMIQFSEYVKDAGETALANAGAITGAAAGVFIGTVGVIRDSASIHKNRQMQAAAESFKENPFQAMLDKNTSRIEVLDKEIDALQSKLDNPPTGRLAKFFATSPADLQAQIDIKKKEKGLLVTQNQTIEPKATEFRTATPEKKTELKATISEMNDVASQIKNVSRKAKWMKAISLVKNIVTVAAGIVTIVAAATAMATPVGWALAATAAGVGIGLGIAKLVAIKKNESEVKGLKKDLESLPQKITGKEDELSTLEAIDSANRTPEQNTKITDLKNEIKSLKTEETTKSSKLRKKDPETASRELLMALNGTDPLKASAARHLAQNVLNVGDMDRLHIDVNNPASMAVAMKYLSKKMPSL